MKSKKQIRGYESVGDMYLLDDRYILFVVDRRTCGNVNASILKKRDKMVFVMYGPNVGEVVLPVFKKRGLERLGNIRDYVEGNNMSLVKERCAAYRGYIKSCR